MPKRRSGQQQRKRDPALLEKLRTKQQMAKSVRLGSKVHGVGKGKSKEEDDKANALMELFDKMPLPRGTKIDKGKINQVLNMMSRFGPEETLKQLGIDESAIGSFLESFKSVGNGRADDGPVHTKKEETKEGSVERSGDGETDVTPEVTEPNIDGPVNTQTYTRKPLKPYQPPKKKD